MRLRRRDLVDLRLDTREKLPVGSHYFPEYSDWRMSRSVRRLPLGAMCVRRGYRAAVSPRARVAAVTAVAAAGSGRARRRRRSRCRPARRRVARRARAAAGRAAADARARRPRRPRGASPSRRGAALYAAGQARAGRPRVRAARLARGARRPGVRRLAGRDGRPAEPARRPPPAERGRAAQPRHRALLGRPGAARRTHGGRRPPPSPTRRTPSRRATCSIPTTRRGLPIFVPDGAAAGGARPPAARSQLALLRASAPHGACARSSSTASRCSGSGGSGRPSACSRARPQAPDERRGAGRGGGRALRQGATRPRRSPGSGR